MSTIFDRKGGKLNLTTVSRFRVNHHGRCNNRLGLSEQKGVSLSGWRALNNNQPGLGLVYMETLKVASSSRCCGLTFSGLTEGISVVINTINNKQFGAREARRSCCALFISRKRILHPVWYLHRGNMGLVFRSRFGYILK